MGGCSSFTRVDNWPLLDLYLFILLDLLLTAVKTLLCVQTFLSFVGKSVLPLSRLSVILPGAGKIPYQLSNPITRILFDTNARTPSFPFEQVVSCNPSQKGFNNSLIVYVGVEKATIT